MAALIRLALLFVLLPAGAPSVAAQGSAASEEQVKAVFLFNFAHFVDWPAAAFASSSQPFVIGLLGGEDLVPLLEEAVRGEGRDGHPFLVRRTALPAAGEVAHILFIGRSQGEQLGRLLSAPARRGTLTVSDVPGAAQRGVMIELVNDRNRLRLRINLAAARAAGLTISSNLLRPAEIVGGEGP